MPHLAFAYNDEESAPLIKEKLRISAHMKESHPEFYNNYEDIFRVLSQAYVAAVNYKTKSRQTEFQENEVNPKDYFDLDRYNFENGSERQLFRDILTYKYKVTNLAKVAELTDTTQMLIEGMKQEDPDDELLEIMSYFDTEAENHQILIGYRKKPSNLSPVLKFFGLNKIEKALREEEFSGMVLIPRYLDFF
jgi:hypothetical protein